MVGASQTYADRGFKPISSNRSGARETQALTFTGMRMSDIISLLILRIALPGGNYETSRHTSRYSSLQRLRSPRAVVARTPRRHPRVPTQKQHLTPSRSPTYPSTPCPPPSQTTPTHPMKPMTPMRQRPVSSACPLMAATFNTTSVIRARRLASPGPAEDSAHNQEAQEGSIHAVAHPEPLPAFTWQFPLLQTPSRNQNRYPPRA